MSEAASILFGEKPTAAPAMSPEEAALRVVYSEEKDPKAQEWVAGVIRNRLKASGGKDFTSVVSAPGQFEPWGNGSAAKVDVTSPEFKKMAARVGPILRGEVNDPSGGMNHFYASGAQQALGRDKPDFDNGKGTKVGNTLFFKVDGESAPQAAASDSSANDILFGDIGKLNVRPESMVSFSSLAGLQGTSNDEGRPTSDRGDTPFREVKGVRVPGVLTKAQEDLYIALVKGGGYKPGEGKEGSPEDPYFVQTDDAAKDVPAGAYYVDRDGHFRRAAGGDDLGAVEKLKRGGVRGAADVALSVGKLLPGTDDSTVLNRLITNQQAYDADLKGDPLAGTARFLGQTLTSAPLLAGAEAAVAPTLGTGALGRFLIGEAGTQMAPGAARLLTRGGSLATKGALEGAGAGALVSSASDAPLKDQLLTGAAAGAVLGPTLPWVLNKGGEAGTAVRDMFARWTYGGRENTIDRLIKDLAPNGYSLDTRVLVPGSEPTMAEAAGEAGISALERNARTNPKLAQVMHERLDQNAQARRDFFESIAKDHEAIDAARTLREQRTGQLREAAFKDAAEADPAPILAKIDEILASPSGQRDVVVKALKVIREKLANGAEFPPTASNGQLSGQTDVQQLYGIRKSINDMLDPLGPQETRGAALAKSELKSVKDAIDAVIEKAAPGFKQYLTTYEEMSRPIDEMRLLQSLKLTDQHGNITLAKVKGAVERIEQQRGAPGANKAKSVSDDTLKALKDLQTDLERAANIHKGKAAGSDTAQNLVMQKFAEGGGVPLGVASVVNTKVPGGGLVIGAANKAVAAQNDKMLGQLATRLLNPSSVQQIVTPRLQTRPPILPKLVSPLAATAGANLTRPQ